MHQGPGGVGVIKVEVGKLHAAVLHDLVPPAPLARACGSVRPAGGGSRRNAVAAPARGTGAASRERSFGLTVGRRRGRSERLSRLARPPSTSSNQRDYCRRRTRQCGRTLCGQGGAGGSSSSLPSAIRSSRTTWRSPTGRRRRRRAPSSWRQRRNSATPPMSIISTEGVRSERVKVAHHQPHRDDPVPRQVGLVPGFVHVGQDAAVHHWVKCFDPPAEDLREPGHRFDSSVPDTSLREHRRRLAAGHQFVPGTGQGRRKTLQACLVVKGQQSSQFAPLDRVWANWSMNWRIVSG